MSRRQWGVGLLGLIAGIGASSGVGALASAFETTETSGPASRGSLAWALDMVHAGDAELLDAAGDLERVSMRHADEPRLAPVFERVLDVVVASEHPLVDIAGCCAVRSLERIGRVGVASVKRASIVRNRRLPQTARLIEDALARAARRR